MKTLISTLSLLCIFTLSHPLLAQSKRVPASAGRLEFIEVEPNVKLHVTDLGEGQPIVLIHGWPLNDAMYEYQYQYHDQIRSDHITPHHITSHGHDMTCHSIP